MKHAIVWAMLLLTASTQLAYAKGSDKSDAKPDVQAEMKKDVVLRAMVDELQRSKSYLHLEGLEAPYFIEYGMSDTDSTVFMANLGSITGSRTMRERTLRVDVRVGSYALDNSNFGGGYGNYFGNMGGDGGASVPIEDDYDAIRQAIWWATDRDYKDVVETFEQKKAFMQSKMITDKPDDFSHEEPTTYFEKRITPKIDVSNLEATAKELSAVFKEYPEVQESSVSVASGGGNKYLVNTEGTRVRVSGMRFFVAAMATVQADDGMKLSDTVKAYAFSANDMPSLEELKSRVRAMADRLLEVKNAPILNSYSGPVLFEASPAAAMFSMNFSRRFAGGQRPVGSSTSPDDFESKIGKRILPKSVTVIDDPTIEKIDGESVMGHYKFDDQGIPATAVTLVEKGRLKAQVMSRTPSKNSRKSTGHGAGAFGPSASVSCTVVTTDDPLSKEEMQEALIEAVEDEDLEFGLRVEVLGSVGGTAAPLVLYKVYPDGKEELVRGAQFARVDLKDFKRLLAFGDKPHVLNSSGRTAGTTLVAPSMLFEEIDLAKIDRDFDKPPLLTTPLAR